MEFAVVAQPRSGADRSEDAHAILDVPGTPFMAVVLDTHHVGANGTLEAELAAKETVQAFQGGFPKGRGINRFEASFAAADACMLKRFPAYGAVLTAVCIERQKMHVAHLGDTRLYVNAWCEQGFNILTKDHVASSRSEIFRMGEALNSGRFQVRACVEHGRVVYRLFRKSYWWWVKSGLQPTRGLGDSAFRPALSSEPEVMMVSLRDYPTGTVFALCSDGAQRAVERAFAKTRGQASMMDLGEIAAHAEQALTFQLDDDATAIFFRAN